MEVKSEIKIVERRPIMVLSTRGMAASISFEERYAKLYREAFMKKLQVVGSPMVIYHGSHLDGQQDDLEVALPVNQDAPSVREIPGGLYACASHTGAYGTLPMTHMLVGIWLTQQGYEISGSPYDFYIRGGNDKILSPEQYFTEVYIPVKQKS